MSATEERELEIIAGTIGGITQKKADTWTVQVTPEGSKYAKNLWTQDVELVESLQTKIGQVGAFVGSLGTPYMVQGKEVRSWWIDSLENADGIAVTKPAETRATPEAAVSPATLTAYQKQTSEGMSKEEWARKDSAIHKMACIKTAAAVLTHTLPSDPTPEDLGTFLRRCQTLYNAWHRTVLAERDDPAGENVPF